VVQLVRSSSARPGRGRLAALAVALAALVAPLGAAPAQAAVGPPVVPTAFGHLTWSFASTVPLTQRQKITTAMTAALLQFNAVANYSGDVPVTYDPSLATASTGYQGTIAFGSTITTGLAQHELGRWLGIGTAPGWSDHVSGGLWTGATALSRVRAYDGPQATVRVSGADFSPYGWSRQSEYYASEKQVGLIGALRADMGLSDGTAAASGTFRVLNRSNERLLSVNAAGTDVLTKSSSATAPQAWGFTPQNGSWTIRDARSGLALDSMSTKAYGVEYGTRVGFRAPSGSGSQRWELEKVDGPWFRLRSVTTRMCLDVRQQPAGTVVRQWGCEIANGDQHWRLALP